MNSTPQCARLISPGRMAPDPPPTSATADVEWCGARNGGRVISPSAGRPTPAAEWTIVASNARERSSDGSSPGQAGREHRLAGAGRADHQQVVTAGSGDLEGLAGQRLALHVGQVGNGAIVDRGPVVARVPARAARR